MRQYHKSPNFSTTQTEYTVYVFVLDFSGLSYRVFFILRVSWVKANNSNLSNFRTISNNLKSILIPVAAACFV